MTGTSISWLANRNSKPFIFGIWTSIITKSIPTFLSRKISLARSDSVHVITAHNVKIIINQTKD